MNETRPLIAVVDDEDSVRRALARMLRASNYLVEGFASGQEFLASLESRHPACVVLDLQMPGMTGRDVQRQLTSLQVKLPIIIVTAHDRPTLREQCLADGAVAYLAKPLRREALISIIDTAIDHDSRHH